MCRLVKVRFQILTLCLAESVSYEMRRRVFWYKFLKVSTTLEVE